jgi:hypothetical protein
MDQAGVCLAKLGMKESQSFGGATPPEITNRPHPPPRALAKPRSSGPWQSRADAAGARTRVRNKRRRHSSWISVWVSVDAALCHACNARTIEGPVHCASILARQLLRGDDAAYKANDRRTIHNCIGAGVSNTPILGFISPHISQPTRGPP